jgi:hypothetical protein
VCTTCAAVRTAAPITYFVDPVNGSDGGTGSGDASDGGPIAACALKTVTRALQLINIVNSGGPVAVHTRITIIGGGGATVNAGETFPLTIPGNVDLTTQTGPVTVSVTAGHPGFQLTGATSTLASGPGAPMTITTAIDTGVTPATGGTNAIQVSGTADAATTTISNLTVDGMLGDGVLVAAGSVFISEGVISKNNGIASAPRSGLHVTGSGLAYIRVGSGQAQTTFTLNTSAGILVDTNGSIQLMGATSGSGNTATSTVDTSGNTAAGVFIAQTPGLPNATLSSVTGLVSDATTGGSGMQVVAGSNVEVRSSFFLGNAQNGVRITANSGAAASNDVTGIDLGTTALTGPGGNVFQAPLNAGNNGGAGICLAIGRSSPPGQTLSAEGNTFRGVTCTGATTTALLLTNGTCANSVTACAGGVCDLGYETAAASANNTFDVSPCAP